MATASTPTSEDRRTQVARSGINGSNSLGAMLRRARELRGLTLERVARETKIPQRHLEALERDNLTVIPSGFYQRAELRTYAQAVGLDQRVALAELESALAPPDTRESRETQQSSATTTSPLPYIAVAVAAIAVVAVLYGRASVEDTPQPAPAAAAASAPASTPQPSVSSSVPSSEPSSEVTPSPVITPSQVATSVVAPEKQAEAITQAPVPAVVTELVVTSDPEGARVTVNGIGWGSSPATIQYLEPGPKRIRVSKEGYVAVERVLQVEQGQRQTLNVRLDAAQ